METMPAMPGSASTVHPAIEVGSRARFEILFAVLLGLFLSALDQTIVGPVLPRIVTDLNGADLYTWVVTAYLLTSTVTIPVYGKLSDLYGRRADADDRDRAVPDRFGTLGPEPDHVAAHRVPCHPGPGCGRPLPHLAGRDR